MTEFPYFLPHLQIFGEVTGLWERQGIVCMASSIGPIETVVDFIDADVGMQLGQFAKLRFELTEAWLIENSKAKNLKSPATPRTRVAVKGPPSDQCLVAEGRIAYETIVTQVRKLHFGCLQANLQGGRKTQLALR